MLHMKARKRKRTTLGPLEEDIMRHLSAGDLLMSFLLSARSTRAFYREANRRSLARYRYKRSVEGLHEKGLVSRHGDAIQLTEKGKDFANILSARMAPVGNVWKGTWWIVMYDIPVSNNPFRFELRAILLRAGFRKLQHSVWIYPHPCKELEVFLRNNPLVGAFVRYMEILPFTGFETFASWKKLSTR